MINTNYELDVFLKDNADKISYKFLHEFLRPFLSDELYNRAVEWFNEKHPLICPNGKFIAYKKIRGEYIVELEIPEDAMRTNGYDGKRCRASKAKVLRITRNWESVKKGYSIFDPEFCYCVGETVEADKFDPDRWGVGGIHFYLTKKEAKEHNVGFDYEYKTKR